MPVASSHILKAALLAVSLATVASPVALSEEVSEATAQTANFVDKANLAGKATLAPMANLAEKSESAGKAECASKADFAGKAAFYHSDLHGRKTASGQQYDEGKLTAAHKNLPFGTKVTVINRKNGKTCTLTINDRGPYAPNHVIDVSKAAAKELGLMNDNKRIVDCFIRIDAKDLIKKQNLKDTVRVAAQPEGETL